MQNDAEWTMKYYNDAAQAKVEERRQLWSPEYRTHALREDPARDIGQALAAR